jgi:hypothetical protein
MVYVRRIIAKPQVVFERWRALSGLRGMLMWAADPGLRCVAGLS